MPRLRLAVDVPAPRKLSRIARTVDVLTARASQSIFKKTSLTACIEWSCIVPRRLFVAGSVIGLVEQRAKNEILLSRVGPFLRSKPP